MPQYKYQVRESTGGVSAGTIAAPNLGEAASIVRNQGGQLLDISPTGRGQGNLLDRVRNFRVDFGPGPKDVLAFTTELAVMIKAGISVRDAVAGMGHQAVDSILDVVVGRRPDYLANPEVWPRRRQAGARP